MFSKKLFTFFLYLIISSVTISCKKDDELKSQIANLENRVSNIESQLSQINSSIISLQQQGKLNLDEITSLKNLTENLRVVTNELKNTGNINSSEIINLQSAIQQSVNTIQYDDLKKTIITLNDLMNKMASDQKVSESNAKSLQNIVSQISVDLDKLKVVDSFEEISGKIEKGGFLKGSTISFYEMNGSLL